MPRFTADVDSPPAKEAVPKIKPQPEYSEMDLLSNTKSPAKKRRMRRLRSKLRHDNKKTLTSAVEIVLLSAIAISLAFFALRDLLMTPKSSCMTHIPRSFTHQLTKELRSHLFRQDVVVQNISSLLEAHESLTAMTFVGGCGTGKSFTATLMAQHFTEDHSHAFHWPEEAADREEAHLHHLKALQGAIIGLPSCYPQLLVVDNLSWQQKPFVEDLLRWLKSNSLMKEKNLVLVFIFNLQTYGDEETGVRELEEGNLLKTNLVVFRSFQETDGMDYLIQFREREEKAGRGREALGREHWAEVVASAQVHRYGLKRLVNKFHVVL